MQGRDGVPERPSRRAPRAAAAAIATKAAPALAATALLLAAACSGGGAASHSSKAAATKAAAPVAQLAITPANGSVNVKPSEPITVTATHGKLTDVSVKTNGTQVTGTYSQGNTVWRSDWTLGTAQKFVVTASAQGTDGKAVTATSSFHSLTPSSAFTTQIFEGAGATYGVGVPIVLNFSQPITNKAAVERALQIRTSKPVVGAWMWDGDQALHFRPKSYWPTHTTVWFTGHLDGVEGAPGLYGNADLTQTFYVGDSLIVHISTSHHRMSVYRNGTRIYNWPVSTGQAGDDTPNGAFLTLDKGNPVEMKPADIKPGQPGYYDVQVFYSVRFTWSGDYIHSAPWSVGEQGFSNVSHGCVNLSPAYAPIYYNMEVPGDPVIVSGSPLNGQWDDGWTDWFLSWHQLLNRSATGQAVQAGPTGSSFVDPATLNAPSTTAPSSSATPAATSSPTH